MKVLICSSASPPDKHKLYQRVSKASKLSFKRWIREVSVVHSRALNCGINWSPEIQLSFRPENKPMRLNNWRSILFPQGIYDKRTDHHLSYL